MTADPEEAGSAPARHRTLLIYVPGLGGRRSDAKPLLERLRNDLDLDVKCWDHGLRWWSTADMTASARRLAIQIRAWTGEHEVSARYDRLILMGHSAGGVLVRNAYLLDAGRTAEHEPAHAWTSAVDRMVLLAAPNAGFHSRRLPWPARMGYTISSPVSHFTVEQLRAGSDYITELRLRWVKAARSEPAVPGGRGLPIVVQVLGDRDRYVYRDECLDIDYIPNAVVIEVPNTTHDDLPHLDEHAAPYRYELIKHALATTFDKAVLDRHPPESLVPDPAKPLAILLHGIRTERFLAWMPRLAERLQQPSAEAPGMDVYAPTYGYFSAVDFAVPGLRRRNTRRFLGWYCDQYVLRAPGTQIHFAGHSNGTYMLGHALRRVPAVRFDNVFLAASVLPREYPWTVHHPGRPCAERMRNRRLGRRPLLFGAARPDHARHRHWRIPRIR